MGSKRHQDSKLRNATQANKTNKTSEQQEEENRKLLKVWALVFAAVIAFVAFCVAVGGEATQLCIAALFFGLFGYAVWAKAGGNV